MSDWEHSDLERIGDSTELQISSTRPDGTPRPFVTIWVVRAGDDLYVRSAYGRDNGWFRRARSSGTGRIRAGGVERDVAFVDAIRACTPRRRRRLPPQVRPLRAEDRRHGHRGPRGPRHPPARAAFLSSCALPAVGSTPSSHALRSSTEVTPKACILW